MSLSSSLHFVIVLYPTIYKAIIPSTSSSCNISYGIDILLGSRPAGAEGVGLDRGKMTHFLRVCIVRGPLKWEVGVVRGTSVTGLLAGASEVGASGSSGMAVPGISSGSSSISVGVKADDDIGVDGVDSYSGSESDVSLRMMG